MKTHQPKPTVLVVDDTLANLKLLEAILTKSGYSVKPARSGKLALMAAKHAAPDIVLLDISMPDMDGYETCIRLKKIPGLEEIPVIFISANSETPEKVKAFQVGGLDYVTKPFQVEEVLARLETHIKLRRYQIESERKSIELQATLDRLRTAQSQLVNSEKMASLGVLSAGVAHEINNPINYINSSAKALTKLGAQMNEIIQHCKDLNSDSLADFKKYWAEVDHKMLTEGFSLLTENISHGAERAANIVQSLKTFSRIDRSEKTSYQLHEGIESTIQLLAHKSRDIEIKRNYDSLPTVVCHPGRINQVLMNLLSNAIDSFENQGQSIIEISTKTLKNNRVSIEIMDNGNGISDADIHKIFDPFFTTKEIGEGTGLGLSISLGIIQEHKGSITLASNSPAQGTTARIILPIADL